MKIYLASRYSRREELCGYRTQLESMGVEVTSRWLNGAHQISDTGVPIDNDPLYPDVVDVAPGDFSAPLQLLAQRLAFDDPLSGVHRDFVSGRVL